ncbi:MAG: hypothetical protein KF767_07610 [Bdellovibrionaceae bacterium]|nr:hypothetical protein [Pseudobdellovibrionaceae bacterium]
MNLLLFLFLMGLFFAGCAVINRALKSRPRGRRAKTSVKSKLAMTATGHVEVEGFAWPIHEPVTTLRDGQAVYYTIKLQRRVARGSGGDRRQEWLTCWSRSFRDPFFVVDGTGVAILRPDGAEVETATQRTTPWNRVSKNDQENFVSAMLDVAIPEFPPSRGPMDFLKSSEFRIVEEEILVGAPLDVMGAFHAGVAPFDMPAVLKHFAAQVFDPATRAIRDNATLLQANRDSKAIEGENHNGYVLAARKAARMLNRPEPAGYEQYKICGEIRASGEAHYLIADRYDESVTGKPDRFYWPQLVGGGVAIAVSVIWIFATITPWVREQSDQTQSRVAQEARADAEKNKPTPQELKRRSWRRQMARLDRQAFGMQAEEIPSTSFELNDVGQEKPIPLALTYGIFLIEPQNLQVVRYDDDLRGVGETPGLLHVSGEGQVVVQDLNKRLVVLDLVNRTRTPYPFQAAAAIIEGGQLYWMRVEDQLARVYRTRIRDFDTVELATNLSFPQASTAEFIRVSEKIHLLTRNTAGKVTSQFEILLNELSAEPSPQLSGALADSDERMKKSCPACEAKDEAVSARISTVGQLNVVYEIYTKRIFWIGNEKKSRLISSAGPPNEERLQGTDCLRQPQRCLSLEANDRLEYFGNYGREFWAQQAQSLHYLCMSSGGRACEALLFSLEGRQVSAAVREQYLWASCRTANAFSCRELIRRNVPYKGWAEFAMGNFLAFEQRLPANSVEGVDMVDESQKKDHE